MQRRHTGENHLSVPNLEFPKTGIQIKESVAKLVEKYLKKIETDKAEIVKIAKFREIDVKALVEAKDARVIIATSNAYSTAISDQAVQFGGGPILMKYNQDVNRIKQLVQQIESYFYDKNTYLTVVNNLPDEPTFKLSWDELEELGFRSEDAEGAPDAKAAVPQDVLVGAANPNA